MELTRYVREVLAGGKMASATECKNFLRRSLAALDCAVDSADVANAGGFASEEQAIVDWLRKNLLGVEAVDGDVAVGAAREAKDLKPILRGH